MKEFSELTLQKLNQNGNYYVYGLVDPRNNKLFYIGKEQKTECFSMLRIVIRIQTRRKKNFKLLEILRIRGNRLYIF